MPTIAASGIDIHHEIQGEGPDLLLISGLGGHSGAWAPALPFLTSRFRCITFDNRGTGRSSVPAGPYAIDELADDAAALIEALGIGPVRVVGWSLGGSVLQSMLIRHPQAVRAAVLLNAFPNYTEIQDGWLDAHIALRRSGADPLAIAVMSMPWGLTEASLLDHARAIEMARMAVADPWPTSLEGFEAQAAGLRVYDSRADLPKVTRPTLVLSGAEDVLTPPEQSETMAGLIPGAELKVLPRGSHRMVVEYPREVTDEIAHFFSRN